MLDKVAKLYSKIKTVDVPMTGFLVFMLYSVIAGFSIASAIASFAICGLYGFRMLLQAKKESQKVIDINTELMAKIAYLESSVNVLKVGSGFRTQDTSNDKSKRLF